MGPGAAGGADPGGGRDAPAADRVAGQPGGDGPPLSESRPGAALRLPAGRRARPHLRCGARRHRAAVAVRPPDAAEHPRTPCAGGQLPQCEPGPATGRGQRASAAARGRTPAAGAGAAARTRTRRGGGGRRVPRTPPGRLLLAERGGPDRLPQPGGRDAGGRRCGGAAGYAALGVAALAARPGVRGPVPGRGDRPAADDLHRAASPRHLALLPAVPRRGRGERAHHTRRHRTGPPAPGPRPGRGGTAGRRHRSLPPHPSGRRAQRGGRRRRRGGTRRRSARARLRPGRHGPADGRGGAPPHRRAPRLPGRGDGAFGRGAALLRGTRGTRAGIRCPGVLREHRRPRTGSRAQCPSGTGWPPGHTCR